MEDEGSEIGGVHVGWIPVKHQLPSRGHIEDSGTGGVFGIVGYRHEQDVSGLELVDEGSRVWRRGEPVADVSGCILWKVMQPS